MCLPVAKTHLPTSIFRHLGYLIRIPKLPIFFRLEDFWTYSLKRREKLSQCEIDTHGTFFQFLMSKGEVFFIGTKRCKNLLRWLCCRQKKITFFFWRFCFWKKWFFSRGGGDSWWYVKYVWMNSRQKSATFVTVRRAMTNFDPLWLKKKWWNQSPHPRQNLWSLLSLGVAPLTRAWQPRCCFHQCMFFELSYVAIRLWLEDQTDKGDFKVESSVGGRGNSWWFQFWGRGLFSYSVVIKG